jgi:hypothetical protein
MSIIGPTTDHAEIRRWAESKGAVPTEVLPHVLDSEPALLRIMFAEQARDLADVRIIAWEEFFVKFDGLGLTFVYDDDRGGYNEILQNEEKSPYRHPKYRPSMLGTDAD